MILNRNKKIVIPKLSTTIIRRTIAYSLGFLFIISLIYVSHFALEKISKNEKTLTIREVAIYSIPPPPPPPSKKFSENEQQGDVISASDIALGDEGSVLQFSKEPPKIAVDKIEIESTKIDMGSFNWKQTLASSFPEVNMENLDRIPTLLRSKPVRIPRALRARGIKEVRVKIQIVIDESGKGYLRKFLNIPYPEMESVMREYIKSLKFSIPTKDGLPVHAIYSWPLVFRETS